jgi:vacuolar-type H+-ATPase subunit H
MEVRRSTDLIQKEIRRESEERAAKIVDTAKEKAKKIDEKWDKKLENDVLNLKSRAKTRLKEAGGEIKNREEMEAKRIKLEVENGALVAAMENYWTGAPRENSLAFLARDVLKKIFGNTGDLENGVSFTALNMGQNEADALLQGLGLSAVSVKVQNKDDFSRPPMVIIESGTIRITSGVFVSAREALLDCRMEFAEALLE